MDSRNLQMGAGSASRFHPPHHAPPSSPPASPPRLRQHQHSNSISESLADNQTLQSTIEKSQLLEYSVLRAYPPANASKRRVTPPQPRLIVPPSPPESFIASGTRQYRSGSSATVKTMPRQEEEPDPVPIISSLKGRFNKALNMSRGSHSRQNSDVEPGKNLTPTTINTQSPQTAPNSANTLNYSAISTAHTSVYSHTFPIPDTLIEEKGKEGSTDSNSSYGLDSYYEGTTSRSPSQHRFDQGRQTSAGRELGIDVQDLEAAGEVRIEIRRPTGKENTPTSPPPPDLFFKDVYRSRGRATSPMRGPSNTGITTESRHMEKEMGDKGHHGMSSGDEEGPLGLRRHRALPNLRDRLNLPDVSSRDLSVGSFGNQTKTSDELADETAEYFEEFGFGDSTSLGIKGAAYDRSGMTDRDSESLDPANSSSTILGDLSVGSIVSLNQPSNSSSNSPSNIKRPGHLGRSHTSSSSNVLRSTPGTRPSPGRLLTGQSVASVERSSSIDASDAAEIVRCLGSDVGKRLSMLSSSNVSVKSNSGLGAGFAVVVTADGTGEINNLSGRLISITDDEDRTSTSLGEYGSSFGKKDKGKERAMSEQGGQSTGESENSKDEFVESSYGSHVPGKLLDGTDKIHNENIRVHPGDERYEFVYRVRSSSPDNQPLLVPFYKSPPQSNFPFCNAMTSFPQQTSQSQNESPDIVTSPKAASPKEGLSKPKQHIVIPVPGDGAEDTTISTQDAERHLRTGSEAQTSDNGSVYSVESSDNMIPQPPEAVLQRPERHKTISATNEGIIIGGKHRGDARISIPAIILPAGHPAGRRRSLELFNTLDALCARLRSVDVLDEDDPEGESGRRQFNAPPRIINKVYPVVIPGREIPSHQEPSNGQSLQPEHLAMQQKYSRVLLFLCCLFPPLLIVLAYGGMDELMATFTDGRVDNVGVFYKRVALYVGAFVGTMCCVIPITVGILAGLGAL